MKIKEILTMLVPKWLRAAAEPLPSAKELRAAVKKEREEIAQHTQDIATMCDERRRESRPPVTSGNGC